eukprot:TRINITY_DN29522_c0_g1_i1.p1 TRINITY_DN29522_c0_g1~~TRINITY_DN29522_c0_g1_i1.p1  ORF type:complete len:206 (-),score=21.58 TRINITY_DN29522_c0_g1_i1:239-856(-)
MCIRDSINAEYGEPDNAHAHRVGESMQPAVPTSAAPAVQLHLRDVASNEPQDSQTAPCIPVRRTRPCSDRRFRRYRVLMQEQPVHSIPPGVSPQADMVGGVHQEVDDEIASINQCAGRITGLRETDRPSSRHEHRPNDTLAMQHHPLQRNSTTPLPEAHQPMPPKRKNDRRSSGRHQLRVLHEYSIESYEPRPERHPSIPNEKSP